MKAFVITLKNDKYSEKNADRCIKTANEIGRINVDKFYGVDKAEAFKKLEELNLEWTWADGNTREIECPVTGLKQFPYTTNDLRAKIGCSLSHYLLWKKCAEENEPFLILEHDAVFVRKFPKFEFKGVCQINDPRGATRKGTWWSNHMKQRGTKGVHTKTWVTSNKERTIPDGLAGNSAYVINPHAAMDLTMMMENLGVWPNDALMCKQLFPYLEEYYPFITEAQQTKSTTTGK